MRRYRTAIIIALVGIIPIAAVIFGLRFFVPAEQPRKPQAQAAAAAPKAPAAEKPELRLVLAAARDLPVGTLLAEDDIRKHGIDEKTVGRKHIAVDMLKETGTPYGYVVRKAVAEGLPLTWQALVGPRQRGFLAAVLKPGMRAITIRLNPGTRHSGLVDPGDRVDVILTAESRSNGLQNVLTRTILEDVRVLAIDRRIGSAAGTAAASGEVQRSEIATATLEVSPAETGLLALGEYQGELALAVRPLAAASERAEPLQTVDLQDLLSVPAITPAAPEPALQSTVRVIRGTAVSEESFGLDPRPAAFDNAGIETGP